ncbi:MAG: hypothetical protein J6B34_03970 [Clostridia bacterium]|nr:hypothetical protein [Clostridia bacterium]
MKKIISLLMCLLLFSSSFIPVSALDSDINTESVPGEIERDFQLIFAGKHQLNDYPSDDTGNISLIDFLEVSQGAGYTLYAYIYNPACYVIEGISIQITLPDGQALNSSCELVDSYEGRILKYRLSHELISVHQDERSYVIGDIEVTSGVSTITVAVNDTFKFTRIGENTYSVRNEQESVTLNTRHGYYRVNSEGENNYTDIRSVYFSIDNEMLNSMNLNSITASWNEYLIPNTLIVNDKTVSDSLRGQSSEGSPYSVAFDPFEYFDIRLNGQFGVSSNLLSLLAFGCESYFGDYIPGDDFYPKVYSDDFWGKFSQWFDAATWGGEYSTILKRENSLNDIPFIIYTTSDMSANEQIIATAVDFFNQNTIDINGLEKLNTFDSVKFDIESNSSLDQFTVASLFERFLLFTGPEKFKNELMYNNLVKVNYEDASLSDAEFSEKYLVDQGSATLMKQELNMNSTMFILRYAQTSYRVNEAWVIERGGNSLACRAYSCDSTFVQGFDTIQCGFEKNGVHVIYPVNSSPTNSLPDFTSNQEPSVLPGTSIFQGMFNNLKDILEVIKSALVVTFIIVTALFAVTIISKILKKGNSKNEK